MGYPGLVGRSKVGKAAAPYWNEQLLPHGSKSLEWILPKGKGFQPIPALLDEYYSKHLLAQIPRIVKRALALQRIESTAVIPRQVNVYLEQATRAFVAGLWDATAALARACLEATLEDRVGRLIGRQHRDLRSPRINSQRRRRGDCVGFRRRSCAIYERWRAIATNANW
jgi:hypothetical protein